MASFEVVDQDPVKMFGKVADDMQGWVKVEADTPREAAEDYALACWEADPSSCPTGVVWVRNGEGHVIKFTVNIDFEPHVSAGLGERVL